jgi:ribonuclease VapC
MIIDTSAIVAMLRGESEAPKIFDAIAEADVRRMSAANYLETAVVVDSNRDPIMSRRLDDLLQNSDISITPVTEAQARIAREAYRDFGKGSGHPARLNFGDCFAYALAIDSGEPLLFKGDDFGHTNVKRVLT